MSMVLAPLLIAAALQLALVIDPAGTLRQKTTQAKSATVPLNGDPGIASPTILSGTRLYGVAPSAESERRA